MDCINEESSALYTATLKDPEGNVVALAMLSALTLTLHDPETGGLINGRDAQDVLNKNDVTIDAAGELSWSIQPEDTVIVDDTKLKENRTALFRFVWSGGQHHHAYEFQVKNLGKVPAA